MSTRPDGCSGGSRPSKNNRQGVSEAPEPSESGNRGANRPGKLDPSDLPGNTGLRPLSVEPGTRLRKEAVMGDDQEPTARPWYGTLNAFRRWYSDYLSMNITFEGPDGETVRSRLENSYQPQYGKRYYAKLKDLERGIERRYDSMTTVMLTFSASHLNAQAQPRCPADHMREIADGWNTARKQLHQTLSGYNWEYARVWEPHEGGERSPGGYGHLHVAVFVETDVLDGEDFAPVLDTYTDDVGPAGTDAHTVGNAVSVNDNVENLGSYISEYIGIFGDEVLDRPMYQQMFYAVTWATNTRRVDFSNGAQDIISGEEFRRETGLKPEQRGTTTSDTSGGEAVTDGGQEIEELREEPVLDLDHDEEPDPDGGGWQVDNLCKVTSGEPEYMDPTTGGVEAVEIAGADGVDPPRDLE